MPKVQLLILSNVFKKGIKRLRLFMFNILANNSRFDIYFKTAIPPNSKMNSTPTR